MNRRLRFEILRRDNFTCQYCGRKAPYVSLEVDHVFPRIRGGEDSPENLVTACFDCNRGEKDIAFNNKSNFSILREMRFYIFRIAKANLKRVNEKELVEILNKHLNDMVDYEAFSSYLDNCELDYRKYKNEIQEYLECIEEVNALEFTA